MTIRNFLNYVLQHRVCEDYTTDVLAARQICDLAEKELWAIKQLQSKLPGDFNIAASTLYGGRYDGVHMGCAGWAVDDPSYKEYIAADRGFSEPEAERIFKTAIAFAGDDQLFKKTMDFDVHIVGTASRCFEVVGVERPDMKTIDEYATVRNFQGDAGFIKALGHLKVKPWEGPLINPEDMTDDENDNGVDKDVIESFWLEDDLLQHCYVGLKMEVEVKSLNIGIKFFDKLNGLYCSFFTYLPNEKMVGWKEPSMSHPTHLKELTNLQIVPNTRPPPTEDDPEVEEAIIADLEDKELGELDNFMTDA